MQDKRGNVPSVPSFPGALGYGYDDWGRLNEFDCGSGNWGQQYAYDTNDNLTKTVLSGRTGTTWSPGYSSSTNQCTGCSFDSDGNMTADGSGSNYWGWNEFAKMKWWNTSSIAPTCGTNGKCIIYDAFGQIVKYSNGVGWYDVWITQLGSTTTMTGTSIDFSYWPAPGGRGTVEINSSTSGYNYLHGDWLGNARLLSSVANNTEYRDSAYTPYGEQFATYGLTQSYYQHFAGMTGDFNNGVQWETPNRELGIMGRWLSPDPAGVGWNQYAYPTNPNSFVDPSGLCQFDSDPCGSNDVHGSQSENRDFAVTYMINGVEVSAATFNAAGGSGLRWAFMLTQTQPVNTGEIGSWDSVVWGFNILGGTGPAQPSTATIDDDGNVSYSSNSVAGNWVMLNMQYQTWQFNPAGLSQGFSFSQNGGGFGLSPAGVGGIIAPPANGGIPAKQWHQRHDFFHPTPAECHTIDQDAAVWYGVAMSSWGVARTTGNPYAGAVAVSSMVGGFVEGSYAVAFCPR